MIDLEVALILYLMLRGAVATVGDAGRVRGIAKTWRRWRRLA